MPTQQTWVPGMTYYSNNDTSGTPIPIINQQDLNNLVGAGLNVTAPQPTTPAVTAQTPLQEASSMLSGMTSPMTIEQIRAQETDARARRREQANALFDPTISRAKATGASQVSSAEGVTGQTQGFNLSTAEAQYINQVQGQVNDRIAEIEKSKADWIATGDFEASKRADDAIAKLSEYNNNLIMKKAELALNIGTARRSQTELDLNTISTLSRLPAGKTITLNGQTYTGMATPDPFFSGSDIVSLMKELPTGQSKQITDPSTGETYSITGMASSDPNVKTIQSYNNAGKLTITSYRIDPSTGKATILNQIDGGNIGQSKTNISVNMGQANATATTKILTFLDGVKGGDGKVSPDDYVKARNAWIQESGLKAGDFDKNFGTYVNPSQREWLGIGSNPSSNNDPLSIIVNGGAYSNPNQ